MEGPVKLGTLFLVLLSLFCRSEADFEKDLNKGSPCYQLLEDGTDDLSKAVRCMPPFKNVISNSPVTVSPAERTCGLIHKAEYCAQTGGYYKECQLCDASSPELHHNATYLTDIHTDLNQTSWLSVTMNEGVHEGPVNLTVNLSTSKKYYRPTFHSVLL